MEEVIIDDPHPQLQIEQQHARIKQLQMWLVESDTRYTLVFGQLKSARMEIERLEVKLAEAKKKK